MAAAGAVVWVMRISKHFFFYLPLFSALLVSCEKSSEIKVYRVSKAPLEQSAPQQQDAMPTNTTAPRMPAGLAPATNTSVRYRRIGKRNRCRKCDRPVIWSKATTAQSQTFHL